MTIVIGTKLNHLADGSLVFLCPGCKSFHRVTVGHGMGPRWSWNGSGDVPTFSPSILVTYDGPDAGTSLAPPAICHSFVTEGRIEFLSDCTHDLAGQTVDVPDWQKENFE